MQTQRKITNEHLTDYDHDYKIKFDAIKDVNNPKSIHGIYPYRGKISAIDSQNIISQLPKNATLLDPFCGSGTIIYEAQKHGMKTYGVDMNPLAVTLSKAKVHQPTSLDDILLECQSIIEKAKSILGTINNKEMAEYPRKQFHHTTAGEIMSVSFFENIMSDYLKGAYYGAIALTARGCNHYKWTSSTVGKNIEPKRYINFYEKFFDKVKKHAYFNSGAIPSEVIYGDSRQLSSFIPPKSVDFVFTSPPYFDSLDYTAYYGKLIYDIHKVDRLSIRQTLIQYAGSYEEDMKMVLRELEKVTTDEAVIIFVVGDKKVKNQLINGGKFFADLHDRKPTYIVERTYTGTSSQVFDKLNKTNRKEQIVVWDKARGVMEGI